MFSVVNFEENDCDGPRTSGSPRAYVLSHQRSACDLCRAQKIECHGHEDVCTPCAKSSSHCTYTLSSRTGAGRKRLRSNAGRPSRTSVIQAKKGASVPDRAADTPKRSSFKSPKTSHDTVITQHLDSPPSTTPSVDLDIQAFWDMMPDADTWLNTQAGWSPGSICTHGAHTTTPQDITISTLAEPDTTDHQPISTDPRGVLPSAAQPAPLPLPPTGYDSNLLSKQHLATPNHGSSRRTDDDDDDCSSSTSQLGKHPPAAQDSKTQNPCMCACEVQKILYMPGLRFEIGQALPTDDALLCLQTGIQQCRLTLACTKCDVNADKQILMTTVVGRLVELAVEILDHSAKAELSTTTASTTTTTLFRFGRYVLQSPGIQASLLRSLMATHVGEMEDMLRQLRARINDQQSPLTATILAENESRIRAIGQMLSGTPSDSDGGLGDDVYGCLELSKPMLLSSGSRG